MAKLISISLLDEEIGVEKLLETLSKLSSRDLRKYFKRKKMVFPRSLRYAFLTKCIKRDFQAIQKENLNSDNRVFTEFELVEFYKSVENPSLAQEFKNEFLAYFVKGTYKNYLTDKNLADLYEIAVNKEETAIESIYGFLVGLNPIFTDNEENNLDCLPVEDTAQRIKDQFTLFEVRGFAKKYGVIVPKYPNASDIAPSIVEKAEARELLDEAGLASLREAEANVLLSFAKKHGIYAPRYLKKDEIIDEVISQIASKEIDNAKMSEVFNANLITFKSRSSSDSLCDLLDKYENLDDLSEVRNDNNKDMSPLKRCAVGGAIGLELRYNEESRKARLLERRKKLELLRQQALERKERFNRDRREQELIAQRDESQRLHAEEEARRLAAEERIAELEELLSKQNEERNLEISELEAALKEEEAKRLAAEQALENAPKVEDVQPVEEPTVDEEEIEEEFLGDEIVTPEYYDAVVQEVVEVEEEKEITVMTFEVVEETIEVPAVEEVIEEEIVEEEPQFEEEIVEEEVEEPAVEEEVEEPTEKVEEPVEEVEEPVAEEPTEEEPKPEPVKCPVKKMHIVGGVISAVFAVLLVVLLTGVSSIQNAWNRFTDSSLRPNALSYAVGFVTLFIGIGIVAYLVRVLIHAIRCKAKKGVACNKVSEVYKYLWAHLIVAIISVTTFIFANLFHFGLVKEKLGNIFKKILDNASNIGPLANLMVILVMFIVAYVLTLVICTIVYSLKNKKNPNNGGVMKNLISFCWTLTAFIVVVTVAVVVVFPNVATGIYNTALENIKNTLSLAYAPLVVNAATASGNNGVSLNSITEVIYTFIAGFLGVYLLGLIGLTVGYNVKAKKEKEAKAALEEENTEEVVEVEEVPATEEPVEEPVSDDVVVEEEPEDKLLFTTFEEAKLVEDLNDLNRMIGKVNEHVKDLSAIQARLYNELVGEDEIVVDPLVEDKPVVIPEEPVSKEELVSKEEPVVQEEKEEEPVKEKPKKEPKPKKPHIHCSVRSWQKVFLVLIIVAAVALAIVKPDIYTFIYSLFNPNKESYSPTEVIYFILVIFGVMGVLSFLIRVLIHPIICRARAALYCSHAHEIKRIFWSTVILSIISLIVLLVTDWHAFRTGPWKYLADTAKDLVSGNQVSTEGTIALGIILAVVVLLLLFIIIIIRLLFGRRHVVHTHKKEKSNNDSNNNVDNDVKSSNSDFLNNAKDYNFEDGVMYFPCMINGRIQMMPISKGTLPSPQPMQQNPFMNMNPGQPFMPNTFMQHINPTVTGGTGSQTLEPLEIHQPIKLIQTIDSVAYEKDDEEYYENNQEAVEQQVTNVSKESKVVCPVRKKQKAWFVVTLIMAIALVAAYFLVEPFKNIFEQAKVEKISKLKTTDLFVIGGTFLLVVLIVTQWIRFLLHPISCKINKTKECCKVCERHRYLWTAIFVGIALFAVFAHFGLFGFDKILDTCIFVIKSLLTEGKIYKTVECFALYGGLVFFVLFLLVLLIKTSSHRRSHRRNSKEKKAN